jgi:N4-gp56 family major capsid protein
MIADLINPQVMADMISAKIPMKLVVAPFAKVDTTLAGRPGNTITVPQYAYIGDAVDIAEGIAAETVKLETSTADVTVKKAMKAVELTDEAVLSGYGNPVGETNNQLAKAIASKVDTPYTGLFFAYAKPLTLATPMRSPVNEPGPTVVANTSISEMSISRLSRSRSVITIMFWECFL